MDWINKTGRIVCLNLAHREDRLLAFCKMMEDYEIPFERVEAIYEKGHGARGLRDTMKKLFTEEIEKGTEHLLVFEDDAELVVEKEVFHDTMNKAMEQLPINYLMLFLGCQLTAAEECRWQSTNLIEVVKGFSTHSVLYSLQGMKEITARDFDFPIDNWYSNELQNLKTSYCTYPFLASQRDGFSDIGGNEVSWKPFLDVRYNQALHNVKR